MSHLQRSTVLVSGIVVFVVIKNSKTYEIINCARNGKLLNHVAEYSYELKNCGCPVNEA